MATLKYIKKEANDLINKATRQDQKQRLIEWNNVCESLVNNRSNYSVSLCVKHMVNNGFKITARTVWNGNNSYKTIFNLWGDYLSSVKTNSPNNKAIQVDCDNTFITDKDINAIKDPVLKYQISLMLGQLKGYKKQVDMLNDVRNKQSIQVKLATSQNISIEDAREVILDEYELEILNELLASSAIEFNDDGKMIAAKSLRKGTAISSEGLKQAIEKVLVSYKALG